MNRIYITVNGKDYTVTVRPEGYTTIVVQWESIHPRAVCKARRGGDDMITHSRYVSTSGRVGKQVLAAVAAQGVAL